MKKIILYCFAVFFILFTFDGCGDVSDYKINIDSSAVYSESQLNNAAEAAKDYFWHNFDDCRLTLIDYDEDFSNEFKDHTVEEIILKVEFINKNSEDDFRHFVLVHTDNNNWKVDSCGFF